MFLLIYQYFPKPFFQALERLLRNCFSSYQRYFFEEFKGFFLFFIIFYMIGQSSYVFLYPINFKNLINSCFDFPSSIICFNIFRVESLMFTFGIGQPSSSYSFFFPVKILTFSLDLSFSSDSFSLELLLPCLFLTELSLNYTSILPEKSAALIQSPSLICSYLFGSRGRLLRVVPFFEPRSFTQIFPSLCLITKCFRLTERQSKSIEGS